MKKLVPLVAAISFAAALPAFAATSPHHVRTHAVHHAVAHTAAAPAEPMAAPENYFKSQDTIIAHVVGVPG